MALSFDQVADLIKIIDASACDELVLETAELKLSVRRSAAAPAPGPGVPDRIQPSNAATAPTAAPAPPKSPSAAAPNDGQLDIRSPMVGTFYRAPSPDAPAFVEVGAQVAAGAPLCVIEVMKLFTTVYAEKPGKVVQIGAANGELVEYDSVLFVLETS